MEAIRNWPVAALLLLTACSEQAVQCTPTPNIVDLSSDASPVHDPTIIRQGERYFVFSSSALGDPWLAIGSTIGGIKALRLDPVSLEPFAGAQFSTLAQRFLLLDDPIIEAPYVHYRDGFYYLFMSFNHCCRGADTRYQVRMGRSKSPDGPYYDQRGWPLYLGGGTLLIERDGSYVGTGHADLFSTEGSDWLVHHAKNPLEDYRPYLNIRELRWSEDGWPNVCDS